MLWKPLLAAMVRFMFGEHAMIALLQKAEASRPRSLGSRFRNIPIPISLIAFVVIIGVFDPFACRAASGTTPPAPPSTPRDFFNAGARQLGERKFREAEAFFESALASQESALQPPALYNLGHVRFAQGVEELKKGSANRPTAASARKAEQTAGDAIRNADEALAGDDLQKLIEAYI